MLLNLKQFPKQNIKYTANIKAMTQRGNTPVQLQEQITINTSKGNQCQPLILEMTSTL